MTKLNIARFTLLFGIVVFIIVNVSLETSVIPATNFDIILIIVSGVAMLVSGLYIIAFAPVTINSLYYNSTESINPFDSFTVISNEEELKQLSILVGFGDNSFPIGNTTFYDDYPEHSMLVRDSWLIRHNKLKS